MGWYFEDFEPGRAVTSRGRTITETDVVMFAGLTGDFVELHTNEEYAKETKLGRRVAHGALTFGISIGLSTRMNLLDETLLTFAGVDRLRFVAPVFIGDTIHLVKRVVERRELDPRQGTVVFESRVFNQREELVLIYQDKLLIKRRVTPPENSADA